jgi:hypothetical protein
VICISRHYSYGDISEDDMDGECGFYVEEEKCLEDFGRET